MAEAFARTTEYFNTFGGCNLAMTFGETVLDVIQEEGLQEYARMVGAYAKVRRRRSGGGDGDGGRCVNR